MNDLTPKKLSNLGEAALKLADQGWVVFPVKARSKFPPLTKHGHKDASDDPEQIREWWTKNPDANIAVAAGDLHDGGSGVWSLDFDGEKGLAAKRELEFNHGKLGGLVLKTARGFQHVFKWHNRGCPTAISQNVVPGVDIRSTGGYFMAPPSVHPSGQIYEWEGGKPTEPKGWLLKWIRDNKKPVEKNDSSDSENDRSGLREFSEKAQLEYRTMISYMDGESREDWLAVGFAIYEMGWNENGFDLWRSWSMNWHDSYDSEDQEESWVKFGNGYDGKKITIASIAKRAMEMGWRDPGNIAGLGNGEVEWDEKSAKEMYLVTPRRELLGKLIRRGEMGVLYGDSGVGKSFLVLSMCMALARGEDWMGVPTHKPSKILYIVAEGARGMGVRVNVQSPDGKDLPDNLRFLTHPVNIMDDKQYAKLMERIAEEGYDLVIFDTMARCTVGVEENSNTDMGGVVDRLGAISRLHECTTMLVHHKGKKQPADRGVSKGMRGASAVLAAIDFSLEAIEEFAKDKNGNTLHLIRLVSEKAKDGVIDGEDNILMRKVITESSIEDLDRPGKMHTSLTIELADVSEIQNNGLSPLQIKIHGLIKDLAGIEDSEGKAAGKVPTKDILPTKVVGQPNIVGGFLDGEGHNACKTALRELVNMNYVKMESGHGRSSYYSILLEVDFDPNIGDFIARTE